MLQRLTGIPRRLGPVCPRCGLMMVVAHITPHQSDAAGTFSRVRGSGTFPR
jgi:hypothetical protein